MGKRGPPRTPTPILEARESTLVGRNPNEPKPQKGVPYCPSYIKGEARREFSRLAKLCDRMGVITKVDGNALARYCRLWQRWRRAEEYLEENGESFATGEGGRRQYPEARIALSLSDKLLRLEKEFGLTPAARSMISVEAVAPQAARVKTSDKIQLFEDAG